MDIKTILALVFLCSSVGATLEVDTEIIKISGDDSQETIIQKNETISDDDWSQVVVERTEKTEDEGPKEDSEAEGNEESSGKSRIIKRQVIKIPSGVTKVKVIAPKPMPMPQMRPKRMPPVPRGAMYGGHQRKRPPRRYPPKRPQVDLDDDYEEPKHHRTRDSEGKRTKGHPKRSKVVVKEVTPQEFYHGGEDVQHLSTTNVDNFQNFGKHTRKGHSRKHKKHAHYSSSEENDPPYHRPSRRPSPEDSSYESGGRDSEYSRPIKHHYDSRPSHSHSSPEYEDYAASSVYLKQVPAPNLTGLNLIDPPDMMKEAQLTGFRTGKESESVEHTSRKSPSSRDIQSVFPHQYTSHNPQVATNFGLEEAKTKVKSYSPPSHEFPDPKAFDSFGSGSVRYNQQATAASEQHPTAVPPGSSGLQVVQPPQLGTNQGNGPAAPDTPRPNQRATIRDILQQDCPDYDMLGYCSSPPRYPTIQIANMAVKCPELFDVMNGPVPPEPEDDLTSFSRRSDDDIDIIFDDEVNETRSSDNFDNFPEHSWSSWSRSGSESETACSSEYTIIEPGYAREVTTGRWFVIVQNSDSSLQKVTTDTCLNPGKPCGGLAGVKCSRNRGLHNGIKSTRCIQRYTNQRLISWDPEAPNKCPRIRVFRFPTACVCHLRLM